MNSPCNHSNWKVLESNNFPEVTCLDCNAILTITEAINFTQEHMRLLIEELKASIPVKENKPGRPKKNG